MYWAEILLQIAKLTEENVVQAFSVCPLILLADSTSLIQKGINPHCSETIFSGFSPVIAGSEGKVKPEALYTGLKDSV